MDVKLTQQKAMTAEVQANSVSEVGNKSPNATSLVADIQSVFGLTGLQVTSIVGVSRPVFYKLLSGNHPKDIHHYVRIHQLAIAV